MPLERHFESTYGFTEAETRLVQRLLAAESLQDAARVLGITYETARTRLKSIFRKTKTRRQAELVLLLARKDHRGIPHVGSTRQSRQEK